MLFNKKSKNTTANYQGEKAYVVTPQLELYTAVATAGLSDTFYEGASQRVVAQCYFDYPRQTDTVRLLSKHTFFEYYPVNLLSVLKNLSYGKT